jgi:hypothetical protein
MIGNDLNFESATVNKIKMNHIMTMHCGYDGFLYPYSIKAEMAGETLGGLNMVKADIIFFNGPIITSNRHNDILDAVAVKENRIVYAGNREGVKAFQDRDTEMVDLKGRSMIPGFIDSHLHFALYGMKQGPIIDVTSDKVSSIEEIKSLIREAVKSKKPGEWISLSGYDHNKLTDQRHPTKEDFDQVAPDNPVRCTRACAHMGVYNSLALEEGEIRPEDFAPGEVIVENSELTGLLKEDAHMYMGRKVHFSEEEVLLALKASDELMVSHGITSVHDAGSEGNIMKAMEKASRDGLINVRIYPMIFDLAGKEQGKTLIEHFVAAGITSGFGNEKFSIGPAKIMLDGSSSGPSAATKEPYSHDPELKGILVWQQEEVDEFVDRIHGAGFQVTAHAQGDLAIEIMVNAIEKALKKNPRDDHRHRIEHCGLPNPELIERIRALGIVVTPNPGFIELNGTDYLKYYGDRVKYMYPLKTYLEKGITAAIGSDAPVIKHNPMFGIYGAVTRKDGKTGETVGENQKISLLEAIKMYTYNGAYLSFEEKIKGSIEAGKLADLAVLSENILETETERIKEVKVDRTYIDGKTVFVREQHAEKLAGNS